MFLYQFVRDAAMLVAKRDVPTPWNWPGMQVLFALSCGANKRPDGLLALGFVLYLDHQDC